MWIATNLEKSKIGRLKKRMVLICNECCNIYDRKFDLNWINRSEKHFCSKRCSNKFNTSVRWQNAEYKNKLSASMMIAQNRIDVKNKMLKTQKNTFGSKEYKSKRSMIAKRINSDNKMRLRKSEANKKFYKEHPETITKIHETKKNNNSYGRSKPEDKFALYLTNSFSKIQRSVPIENWSIDFYIADINVYIQFDGVYWHGLDRSIEELQQNITKQGKYILKTFQRDQEQNFWFKQNKIRLIRITDKDFLLMEKQGNISDWINTVLKRG